MASSAIASSLQSLDRLDLDDNISGESDIRIYSEDNSSRAGSYLPQSQTDNNIGRIFVLTLLLAGILNSKLIKSFGKMYLHASGVSSSFIRMTIQRAG
jgi:hypothetical protein